MGKGDVLWAVVCAVICHEIGHLIALSLVGIHVKQISFTAVGVKIQADTRYLSYGREIFCVLAGPLSNILLAVVLARTMHAYLLAGTNLMQGVFNLLPVSGLDGIRILHLLVSWGIDPITADQVCRIVGGFCGGVLTVVTAYLFFQHRTGLFLSLSALGMFWNALRNPDGK
ncbi:MAG: hypothetical protein IKC03_00240 [Oscillospiraceae bacterium]|nr:hypothetical protein [Oscillospiraceae bacterium]